MPNDHVMCFKVWNELYSCLTHDYHDDQTDHVNIVTNHMQDDFSYRGYNDDITDDEHLSSHDIHLQQPLHHGYIQQRLRDLLHCPEEEKLSPNSNPTLTKEEAVDDHTSIKADNVENQHQVNVTIIVDYHYYGCHDSGKWLPRKRLQGLNGYQTMPLLTATLAVSLSTKYYIANTTAGNTCVHVISFLIIAHPTGIVEMSSVIHVQIISVQYSRTVDRSSTCCKKCLNDLTIHRCCC